MSISSVDQILNHVTQSLANKQAVVAAPGGQPMPPPGMGGGALPPVGASPGAPIAPLGPAGGMPPDMMMPPPGAMPPEMMPPPGAMPPGAEDPIMMLQQDMAEMRDLMQQLIDGQTAIIESLVGDAPAPPENSDPAPPPEMMPPPDMMMPPPGAMPPGAMPPGAMPPPGSDDELLNMMQQGLRG